MVLALAAPPNTACMPTEDVDEVTNVSGSDVTRTMRVYTSVGRTSPSGSSPGVHTASGSRSGGGGSSAPRGGSGGLVVAVVVAYAAMVITAYTLSLADPTSSGAADTIDSANQYNDRNAEGQCVSSP